MAASPPNLATARLIFCPLDIPDAAMVQALFPRWETVRYLAKHVPWPYPADGALTYIRDVALPAMRKGMEWHWSIRRKHAPDRLIGVISLSGSSASWTSQETTEASGSIRRGRGRA